MKRLSEDRLLELHLALDEGDSHALHRSLGDAMSHIIALTEVEADLRAQLEQVERERDEAVQTMKLALEDRGELLAENALLRETLHATGFAMSLIELPLTAAYVERVKRLKHLLDECLEWVGEDVSRADSKHDYPSPYWKIAAACAALAEEE